MHIGTSLHDTVAFIGFEDSSSETKIKLIGTGFLLAYENKGYLVTCRHVAEDVGEHPFVVRVNLNGSAKLVSADEIAWHFHPDPLVDLAIIPFSLPIPWGTGSKYLDGDEFLVKDSLAEHGIDIGALCYTLGLFRFIHGQKVNLPMAHAGNIAMLPPMGELIPVVDKRTNKLERVEAFLIESAAIRGASGSPVFARGSFSYTGFRTQHGNVATLLPKAELKLLGVFSSAWFAPPDQVVAGNINSLERFDVPVGFGVVVPYYKILELLEVPELRAKRTEQNMTTAATQASVIVGAPSTASEAENPAHKEDFMRLANAAAQKQK